MPYIVRPLGTLNEWGMVNRRPGLKRLSFELIEKRILDGAAAIHFTSEQEQREAAQLGVSGRSRVLPLGIDLSDFDVPPAANEFPSSIKIQGRCVILFLSRIDKKKGLDLLLPAFAQIRQHNLEAVLVVAGKGNQEFTTRLQEQAGKLGIAQDVLWPGFLAGREKLAAFAAATLFVLPSYSENFGIAALEAMAAGLPVIISDQVGFAPDVERADAGFVVPCNTGALTDALKVALSDPALRRQKGENARCLAHEKFSVQAMTRNLIALYEDVICQP